jgi:hypothetical protein
MTEEEIKTQLRLYAVKQFGENRAQELAGDIEKTAADLFALQKYTINIEDEP